MFIKGYNSIRGWVKKVPEVKHITTQCIFVITCMMLSGNLFATETISFGTKASMSAPKVKEVRSYNDLDFKSLPALRIELPTSYVKPRLNSEFARIYRTRIKEASREKPNFAYIYRVVQWGCGTACQMGAIINLRTGKVSELPISHWGIEAKLNSRLLIVNPVESNDVDIPSYITTQYYQWDGREFHLIREVNYDKSAPSRTQSTKLPFLGKWAPGSLLCNKDSETTDNGPIEITKQGILGFESYCSIENISGGSDSWTLSVTCTNEGYPYKKQVVLKLDGNRLSYQSLGVKELGITEWTDIYFRCP